MHVCTCAPPTKHRPRLDIRPSFIGCAAKMVTDACSEEHNQQLADLLRFLRRKRDAAIAEVAAEFNDTKESRLFEESYHVDDVTAILDGLLSVVRTAMKRDLQRSAFSSVLLLKQVFEQVEEKGIGLTTDLPTTEDRRLLEVVERWDQDVHGGSSSAPPPLRARAVMATRPTNRPLASIGQSQVRGAPLGSHPSSSPRDRQTTERVSTWRAGSQAALGPAEHDRRQCYAPGALQPAAAAMLGRAA